MDRKEYCYKTEIKSLKCKLTKSENQNKKLRKCVEFYADKEREETRGYLRDIEKARETLKEIDNGK